MAAIAREAGVGKATVSLALRNDPRLRAETRQHIQKVAERMGYRANALVSHLMAQLRASRNPKYQATIGILNASPMRSALRSNFTFRAWLSGLQARSVELGYGTDELWLDEPGQSPSRLLQTLHARNIRGVVIAGVLGHREISPQFDLLWEELASVVVGIRPERPALHFACNDQYSTSFHTACEVARLGYTRPGLVIDPAIEANLDHRFSAGFFAGWHRPEDRIPMHPYSPGGRGPFIRWMEQYTPDVIVCTHPEIREWIETSGRRIPRDIGLAHLDLTPELENWSGMNQNNDIVGAFAIDLVVGQLHRNETGIPDRPTCMMTEGQWIAGTTLRSQPTSQGKTKKSTKRK